MQMEWHQSVGNNAITANCIVSSDAHIAKHQLKQHFSSQSGAQRNLYVCMLTPFSSAETHVTHQPSALESIFRWMRQDIELSVKWFSVIQDRNCQDSLLRKSSCLFYLVAKDWCYMFDIKKWCLLGELFCITKQIVSLQTSQLADVAVSVFALFS